jgi:hypothetical protein
MNNMNNTYIDGVFSTLKESAKSQQVNEPTFILQAFAATYGTSCLQLLPEFQVTKYQGIGLQAWEILYSNRENNTQVVWLLEKNGEYVTTTCSLKMLLNLKEIETSFSNLLWSEVAEALPPLNDNLWVESNQEAVKLLIGFTSLYYQSV